MKIVSLVNKGITVNYSNKEVKFNNEGIAEVSKELGESIIENFPKTVWEEGNAPTTKKVEDNQPIDTTEYKGLKAEIERLKGIIVDKTKEVDIAKKGEQTWRDEFQKLQDKVGGNIETKVEDNKGEEEPEEFIVPEKHKDLYEGMKTKSYPQLKKWTKDNLNKSDEELSEIEAMDTKLRRDALIKFVLENYPD